MIDLMRRYADASLVWAAEHTGITSIVTFDHADFAVYRLKGRRAFEILPRE